MNHDPSYSREMIDEKFKAVHIRFSGQDEVLAKILNQTTKTNGRMTRVEKISLVFGTVLVVLLIVSGSRFVDFVIQLFK